jgi:hypothetical protein
MAVTADRAAVDTAVVPPARRWRSPAVLEGALVALAALLVFRGLAPAQLFSNRLPFGGDNAGHAVVPWLTRHELLPHGHLTGWSDAWFGGFPVNQLYPALPNILIALLSYVMPLAVALKLVSALGLVGLPVATWAAARWAGLPRPFPALLAVFAIPSIFDTSCILCGGNVAATLGGEYSFQLGLTLGLLALGAIDRLLRTGERRALTAAVTAAAILSHPLTAIWVVLGGLLLLGLRHPWTTSAGLFGRAAASTAVTLLLAGSWWIPFTAHHAWMTSPDFPKRTAYVFWLLPGNVAWNVVLILIALAGTAVAVWRRRPLVVVLAALSVASVIAFVALPQGQLFNLRVLPFYTLGRWLLVGSAFAELAVWASELPHPSGWARAVSRPLRHAAVLPVALFVVVAGWNAVTYGWVPGTVTRKAHMGSDGQVSVLGIHITVTRLAAWPRTVLGGYEDRSDYPELQGVIAMLRQVAKTDGCGRIDWDRDLAQYDPAGSPFGDDNVLWRAPMWTDGCLTTPSGSLYDSSATTPGLLLDETTASTASPQWKSGLPYQPYDLVGHGVDRLRTLGVRYYLTHGGRAAADAAAAISLRQVASSGRWAVWQFITKDAAIVQPLLGLPTVAPGASTKQWQKIEAGYADQQEAVLSPLVADGPADWPRVSSLGVPKPTPILAAAVSNVSVAADRVSFHVDKTGLPVLVRVSDFPGWSVSGAPQLLRATPNYLVVVPDRNDVVIRRTVTAPQVVGTVSGILGLLGLAALALDRRLLAVLRRRSRPVTQASPAALTPKQPISRRRR